MKQEHTLKQSSSGKAVNGSRFNRGLTKSCTKPSCVELHKFNSSARSLCCSPSFMLAKRIRISLTLASSSSPAVLQSGILWPGVGLGAGVGGEAGAEGSILCGIFAASGLPGEFSDLGAPMRPLESDIDVAKGKASGGGGRAALELISASSMVKG